MIRTEAVECPNGLTNQEVCASVGGIYDVFSQSCTVGDSSYSPQGTCDNFGQQAPGENGQDSGNIFSFLEGFDFGILSNAYCNLAPIFSGGNIPAGCSPPAPGGPGGPPEQQGEAGMSITGKILLGLLLVAVVGGIVYLIVTRSRKK